MAPSTKKPTVYLLSTCPRCRRAKEYMEEHNIDYDAVVVDKLTWEERQVLLMQLRMKNPVVSFPVVKTENEVIFGAGIDDIQRIFGVE